MYLKTKQKNPTVNLSCFELNFWFFPKPGSSICSSQDLQVSTDMQLLPGDNCLPLLGNNVPMTLMESPLDTAPQ